MTCPSCGHEIRMGAKFCEECGQPLARECGHCGSPLAPAAKFCGECGQSVGSSAPPPAPAAPDPVLPEFAAAAERRQLTVMFCDLVDSTKLASSMDPEDWREVVRAYQAACTEVIDGYDGYVAQYLGDGLLVYFGYPRAHEDDTQRAIRAGREIVNAIARLNAPLEGEQGARIAVRSGVHTGLVVIGELGEGARREQLALGDTLSIAARLQEIADPDSVVVSDASLRLVQGLFIVEELGAFTLKGIPQPVRAYRATQTAGVRSRIEAVAAKALTPLVGREQEIGLLLDRWEQVTDGVGQVVLLGGEAGIGKSRLAQVLRERLVDEPHIWFECQASSFHRNSAFYPIVAFLQEGLLFDAQDTPEQKLEKLEWAIGRVGIAARDTVPLLAPLLSLPLPDRYPVNQLSPERSRQRIQEILLGWLLELARRQPLVLLVEDLHWVDPSTLSLLELLVNACPTTQSLFLFTYRLEFSPPWTQRSHVTPIVLSRVTRRQSAEMIAKLSKGRELHQRVIDQIVARADGIPLFVEELTKMVLEADPSGAGAGDLAIPATLHDSLMARLDQLGDAKQHAQLAATIGREFSYELLDAVWDHSEADLQRGLRRLVEAELLYQRGLPPRATYVFKHALIQQTAYQSLVKTRRRGFHERIARALEERFPEQSSSEPEELARHYEGAGLPESAISYYQLAGEQASERWARAEAIAHLSRGIELLQALPEGRERKQREALLQFALGAPLMGSKGNAHPDVERAYGRARALCHEIGEIPGLTKALFGLFAFYLARGQPETAHELGEQLVRRSEHDPEIQLWAGLAVGVPLYFLGNPRRALEHLQEASVSYEPSKHQTLAPEYGQDPRLFSQCYAALALWHLGYPDQALRKSQETVETARRLGRPLDRAFATGLAAALHHMRREPDRTRERSDEAIALSMEHGFPLWLGMGTVFHGWALGEEGHAEQAIEEVRRGLEQLASMETQAGAQQILGLVAECHQSVGLDEEALGSVELALSLAEKSGSTYWNSQPHRLKAQLLLRREAPEEDAEDQFQIAAAVAREQQARSLELRAATGLARLWQRQGKKDKARALLAPIYDWFKEGFDTQDLKDAMALLKELS